MASRTGEARRRVRAGIGDAAGRRSATTPAEVGQAPVGLTPPSARSDAAPRLKRSAAARRIRRASDTAEAEAARGRIRRLAALVRRAGRQRTRADVIEAAITDCLDASAGGSPADRWLACEAAAWALAWMARTGRAGGSAGALFERLVEAAVSAVTSLADGDTLPARFVLVLARLFHDIEACRRMEPPAMAAVAAEIERLSSTRGMPNLAGSAAVVERVVRWTAFRELAAATGTVPWPADTENRWLASASAALRLLGERGRRVGGAGLRPTRGTAALLDALAGQGGRRKRTVAALLAGRSPRRKARRLCPRDLHDADAAVAVMRSDWGGSGLRLLIDYRQPVPLLEIATGDRLLVDGPWDWSLRADDRPLEVDGPWRVDGWESDRRASFLEISAPLPGGRRFGRQVVMLAKERIVILADAVTGADQPAATLADRTPAAGGRLHFSATLRLAGGLEAAAAAETTEVVLSDDRSRALALPLALSEWRVGGGGRLDATAGGLSLSLDTAGPRLYAPLWLDCDPARIGRPLTWRRLTVADSRINLPPWQAVGFRVQVGLEQWLLYRSLDAARNRSLLGCNVSCDFLVGRVRRSGEVARVLEIQ